MKQEYAFILSRIWRPVSYAMMAIGVFLLFFLGARALAQITDPSQVQGKPRQHHDNGGVGFTPFFPLGLGSSSPMIEAEESTKGHVQDSGKFVPASPSENEKHHSTERTSSPEQKQTRSTQKDIRR
jgi:hypothetical protein